MILFFEKTQCFDFPWAYKKKETKGSMHSKKQQQVASKQNGVAMFYVFCLASIEKYVFLAVLSSFAHTWTKSLKNNILVFRHETNISRVNNNVLQ